MMILSFMFVILDSCIFENDITQSNSINVVVFAGRNSDTILNNNYWKKNFVIANFAATSMFVVDVGDS